MTARSIYGKPGGGKSYSTTSFIVTEGVARGRMTFANVKGLNPSMISNYLNWICDYAAGRTEKNFCDLPLNVAKSLMEKLLNRFRGIAAETTKPTLTRNERKLFSILRGRALKENLPELIGGAYDFSGLIHLLPRNPRYIHDENGAQTERTNYFLWYHPDYPDKCIIQPNSVVIIDECSLIFSGIEKDTKFLDQTNMFVSMHRHHGIDLYFIAQNSSQIPKKFREQFEETYYCKKTTAFGAAGGASFNLFVFEGSRTSSDLEKDIRRGGLEQAPITERLNPRVFELYKSFDTQSGIQAPSASSATVLDEKMFGISLRYWLFLAPALFGYFIYSGYTSLTSLAGNDTKLLKPGSAASAPVAAASSASAPINAALPTSTVKQTSSVDDFSSEYRLVGIYTINNRTLALVKHPTIGYRYISDFSFSAQTSMPEILYKGKIINHFTGSFPEVKEKISENNNGRQKTTFGN